MRKYLISLLAPFFLTIYFLLFYYSHNFFKIEFADFASVLGLSLLLTIVLLGVLRLIFRDVQRAVFVTSAFVFLFFTFGHTWDLLKTRSIFPFDSLQHQSILWFVLLIASLVIAVKKPAWIRVLNPMVSVIFGILIFFPMSNIALDTLGKDNNEPTLNVMMPDVQPPAALPDIYYIILDEYAGNSALLNSMGFNNSAFTDSLKERGFYVAADARSNYQSTRFSLPSSLNMTYLDPFYGLPDGYNSPIVTAIKNNATAQTMKKLGYTYILLAHNQLTRSSQLADLSFDGTERGNPDSISGILARLFPIKDFHIEFSDTTWLTAFTQINDTGARNLFYLQKLAEIPKMPEPTFTFAHLLLPHQPFVFGRADGPINPNGRNVDGEIVDQEKYDRASPYLDQVVFTNRVISQLVDTILAESETEPIILIQGDHGYRALCSNCIEERKTWDDQFYADVILPILSAYYLPNGGDSQLYSSISPANSFRVIFDYYFGADMGLIPDSHFRPQDYTTRPFYFVDITATVTNSIANVNGNP